MAMPGVIEAIKGIIGDLSQGAGQFAQGVIAEEDKVEMDPKEKDEYRNKIKNAENAHKQMFYDKARRFIAYYNSDLSGLKDVFKGSDPYDIFCNEFWVNAQTLIPNVYFQNPHAAITADFEMIDRPPVIGTDGVEVPQTPINGTEAAVLLENIVNDYYRLLRWKQKARRCVLDCEVMGMGVPKFGWNTKISESENAEIVLTIDEMTCERFNPMNILIDPECTCLDLSDAKFIIFRHKKATETIKSNTTYKGVKNLKGTSDLIFSGDINEKQQKVEMFGKKLDLERNTLYEIWDITKKKVVTFVDSIDGPIRISDWLWGLNRYPISILAFNEALEGAYPIPDFSSYESQVILKTKLRRKMADLFKKLNRFYGFNSNRVNEAKLQSMMDAETGGLVPFDCKAGESLDGLIKDLNDFVMNDSYMALEKIVNSDIERLSGISDYQRGLMSQSKRTATELLQMSSSQNLRIELKKDIIADWMEDCTQLMIELLQNNADEKKIQRVTGDATAQWPLWNKADIQGKYAVRIDVGSMAKQNPENKQKLALERYDKLARNPLVDQVWLAKETLKAYSEIKTPEEALNKLQVLQYQKPEVLQILAQAGYIDVEGNITAQPTAPAEGITPENPAAPAEEQIAEAVGA